MGLGIFELAQEVHYQPAVDFLDRSWAARRDLLSLSISLELPGLVSLDDQITAFSASANWERLLPASEAVEALVEDTAPGGFTFRTPR